MITTAFILLGIFFTGTAIVWVLTRLILNYAESRSLIDIPNDRSSHQTPTPRGGGLSIVVFFVVALMVIYSSSSMDSDEFLALLGGTLLVAGIGFLDDHRHVPARWRILIHFIAAFWSLAWIGGFPVFSLAEIDIDLGIVGYLVGSLFLVWLLNLFNFMDGIDGIAGSEALFISLVSGLICWVGGQGANAEADVMILMALAAACFGFLLWNWPPASIFMGDVGSGFLGFVLGLMALIIAHKELVTIWFWLILFGVFIADATLTLLRRVFRGERWYEAHCSHAYQHASRRFQSHRIVTLTVIWINTLWLLPLAIAARVWPEHGFSFTCVALVPLFVFAYRYDAGMV